MDAPGSEQDASEVERLRARVAELESKTSAHSSRPAGSRWRTALAVLLVTLAAVLAPLSVVAIWAHDEVSDTDRFVANVTPLASDPAIQAAVSERVTTAIFERLDVKAVTEEAVTALGEQGLPPRVTANLKALSTPLESAVQSFVAERVDRVVRSETFATTWEAASRAAHGQLVGLLSGDTPEGVEIVGDSVRLDLSVLVDRVKEELSAAGLTLVERVPTVNAELTVVTSSDLVRAQRGYRALETAARWLPVLAVLCLVGGIVAARDRRRAVVGAGLALAASMFLLGLALNIARPIYLDAVPTSELPRDAAAAVFDTLVRFIRFNLRAVLVVGLAMALGAWLAGPSSGATAVRRWVGRATGAARSGTERAGLDTGPVGAWVHTHRTLLRGVAIGLALLVYVAADHPTGGWTLRLVVVLVVVLLVIEVLARPPSAGPEPTDPEREPEPARDGDLTGFG